MRLRGKVDQNQGAIVKALRQVGATVQSLASVGGGCPDLLVSRAGDVFLLEVKDPNNPDKRRHKLTPDEMEWHRKWQGHVTTVFTVEEALGAIGAMKR